MYLSISSSVILVHSVVNIEERIWAGGYVLVLHEVQIPLHSLLNGRVHRSSYLVA